jgi:alkyl hydroperoxide reductase subunit AhpC
MLEDAIRTQLAAYLQRITQPVELVRKVKAAQYVAAHPGEVCPAKWEEGDDTLAPSLDLVGKI